MTIFSVLFYSLLSHSVEQYRINCSLPPLCPTHKKRFTQIQNVLPQDIKIHGCIESKHKTSIFTFFQVGILLQWYLVSKQQQKKTKKKYIDSCDLAPVLLHTHKKSTCCFWQFNFLCLVTEQQIVSMPKISTKKNYQITEKIEIFFKTSIAAFHYKPITFFV